MSTSELQIKPIDIKRFVLRRGPLIIVVGLLLFIVLAPLLLTQVRPGYRAETHLMLTPIKQPTLQGRERDVITGDLRDHMRTLSKRVLSYNILHSALNNLPKSEWPAFLHPSKPTARNVFLLMSKMEAQEISGTYLLEVSIEAGNPQGLGPMLNAVTKTFLGQLEKEQEQQYTRQLTYLSEERARITNNVNEQRVKLIELARGVGQRSFLHKAYDAHLDKLQLLQKSYWEVETFRVEQQRELDTVLFENENLGALDLTSVADRRVDDNFGINRMEQWTYESLQELRSTIDGLTPANPERRYVEKRMTAMESYLQLYKTNVRSNTLDNLTSEQDLAMKESWIKAEAAARAAEKASEFLLNEKVEAEQEASDISGVIFNAQEMIYNIDQLMARLAALDSRIDDNQLQAKAPLPMHVDRKAQTPEAPFESNQNKLLIVAFMLSFGFVGAGSFLFDLLDNRVRSRQDIERLLGGAIPEPIPLVAEDDAAGLAHATRNELSQSVGQAYRKLAVRLRRHKPDQGAGIFCLSGTDEQVGASTLCVNLAECFAAYGDRVLLVDLNLKHPAPFWPRTEKTPTSGGDIQKLIKRDDVRGVDVLSGGEQWEVFPATRLNSLLEQARGPYDWVLFDCAPLLEDDTAQLAAQLCDGVLIAVREDKSFYSHLCRVKALLETFEIPAMTVVLNGAHSQPGEWLFTSIQSSLRLLSVLHRECRNVTQRLKRPPEKT